MALAGLLRVFTRPGDLSFRYGGEEFGILLPGTGLEGAVQVAERIRAAAEKELPRTVSAGVACAPPGRRAKPSRDLRGREVLRPVRCSTLTSLRETLNNERGAVLVWVAMFISLFLVAFAVTADYHRVRLHRQELQRSADAAVLSAAPGAKITERIDARGRTWNKTVALDPVETQAAALDAFWRNASVTRAARLLSSIQPDAFVPQGAPDELVVTAQASGDMPFARFGGQKQQTYTVTARAKAVLR